MPPTAGAASGGSTRTDRPWQRANPYRDSFETLLTRFGEYNTDRLPVQAAYRDAVLAANAP